MLLKRAEKNIYLIMEYCSGGDLTNYIKKRGRVETLEYAPSPGSAPTYYPHPKTGGLDEVVVRSFLRQLGELSMPTFMSILLTIITPARALKFLRERNLIHRDIKPQNLLLKPASQDELARGHPLGVPILKVADFGFARSLPNAMMAETLCGSPLYMAPEILRYEKYDAKADLWSVGAVLYETAVGRPPFRAQNHIELLKKIDRTKNIKFPDEDPATVEKDPSLKPVPSDIKKLIRSLLRQFPAERSSYDDFFKSTALAKSKFPRPPRDKDKERIASTSSLTKDPSTEMGDAETVVVGTISSNKRPSPTVLQVAKAVSDSPKPSATPSFKQPAEARVLTQARLSFRRPGQTPVVPLPDAIADAHSSDKCVILLFLCAILLNGCSSPVLGVMDPEQPEQLRRVPTEPARRRQLSTEASIIPGESEEDGLLRREYVMVGDNKTIEFGRTVDGMRPISLTTRRKPYAVLEIAAERRRQASDIAEEGPRLEEKSSNSHKSGHEQGQFTSKPVLNNIFPPPPNPLARPLSTSPSRGSALTRALNMASKKLFGTVSPGVHRVQSTYSYLTGFDKALNSRSQSTMRTPLLLKERSTSTGIRDPFEDDLLSELEELAQKTDVLTRWANEMYEYVKAAPKSALNKQYARNDELTFAIEPLPPLIAFTKLEGEDDDATERRRNAALDAEYNAVTCVALYLLLMAFSQKGIDKLRVHQEGMKMRDPEGTLEVSEGFDDALTWFSTHFMKCSDRIALVRSWLPESAMDGPTWLGQIVYDRALQLASIYHTHYVRNSLQIFAVTKRGSYGTRKYREFVRFGMRCSL